MSLVSMKNVSAPINSFVNIITIVVVVVLFVMWRFYGGDVEIRDAQKVTPSQQDVFVPNATAPRQFERSELQAELDRQGKDLMNNFLLKENTEVTNSNEKTEKKESSSLDEIERSLGLR